MFRWKTQGLVQSQALLLLLLFYAQDLLMHFLKTCLGSGHFHYGHVTLVQSALNRVNIFLQALLGLQAHRLLAVSRASR